MVPDPRVHLVAIPDSAADELRKRFGKVVPEGDFEYAVTRNSHEAVQDLAQTSQVARLGSSRT
jgi:hypothetical protein